MTVDERNEPRPGEAIPDHVCHCGAPLPGWIEYCDDCQAEAPVIRAWIDDGQYTPRPQFVYLRNFGQGQTAVTLPARTITTPAAMLAYLRHHWPGHTIDLSAEPPEGISR